MASDARINTALQSHPKTKKVIRRIGEAGAWHMVCLFLWAAANRPNGDLAGLSSEDLELAIDWRGEPDAFVRTLHECGFLDGQEHAYCIHDWAEHNPWANGSEMRSEKSRWAALCKQHGRREAARLMPEYEKRLLLAEDGQPKGVPESGSGAKNSASGTEMAATGTSENRAIVPDAQKTVPLAGSGSAPSPSPSPSPSPLPKKEREKTTAVEIDTWIASLDGDDAVPEDDPIFDYADRTGIPADYLALSWAVFRDAMRAGKKRQKDWRAHYRNAVRRNWYKLWWFDLTGECKLTTAGEQAKRAAA